MNLGYDERERSMHWPAVNAEVSKIAAFRSASYVNKHGVGFEKANIIEPQPSLEQTTAGTLDIDTCLISRICEPCQRWRNRFILWLFQNMYDCCFPAYASAKSLDSPEPHF